MLSLPGKVGKMHIETRRFILHPLNCQKFKEYWQICDIIGREFWYIADKRTASKIVTTAIFREQFGKLKLNAILLTTLVKP